MNTSNPYYQQNRSEILKLIDTLPRHVLDIGCGKGGVASMLRQNFNEVSIVGFDKYKDDTFNYNDIFKSFYNFDLSNEWPDIDYSIFDYVLILDVLEHLVDPGEVLAKLARILTKGARVIISLPNFHAYSNLYEIIKSGRFPYKESGILDRTHLRFYGKEDARDLIRAHFDINTLMHHYLPPRSQLNKTIGLIFGEQYAAYQNIFLCSAKGS